jgi:hypothetical protein
MFRSSRWFIQRNWSDGSHPRAFPIRVTPPTDGTVLVDHPQTAETDVLRAVVIGDGKFVVTVQPAVMAAARLCQNESPGLGSYSFWPGFHIRMNVYMKVNENPRKKLQPLSKKNEFICLGFP